MIRTVATSLGEPAWLLGLGEEVGDEPSTYRFPDEATFANEFVGTLQNLYEGDGWATRQLAPPVQASAGALVGVVESAAGGSLGSLIAGQLPGSVASVIGPVLADLLDRALDFVIEAAAEAAAAVVGEVIAIVPVLGQLIKVVAQIAISIAHHVAAVDDAMQNKLIDMLQRHCALRASQAVALPTPASGVSPADHFRTVSYAYQLGKPPPLGVVSMYVLLCGAQSEGFGFSNEVQYRYWAMRGMGLPSSAPTPGPSPELQRKMWRLIKGIMGAVQRPTYDPPAIDTDQGRSLMPILQEMVRQEIRGGRVSDAYLRNLSDFAGSRYKRSFKYKSLPTDSVWIIMRGSCSDPPFVNLVSGFKKMMLKWSNSLHECYYRDGRWLLTAQAVALQKFGVHASRARAALVIDKDFSSLIASRASRALVVEPGEPVLTPTQGLAVGTGLVGAGYAGWTALRKFGILGGT